MLLMERIALADRPLRLGVFALSPCRTGPAEAPVKHNQSESNQIKPNQTKSNLRLWGECPEIGHAGMAQRGWRITIRSNPLKPEKKV
jgi:hypothetical protein